VNINGCPGAAVPGPRDQCRRVSRECRLYLITPPELSDLSAFAAACLEAFRAGPVAALQIRLKNAAEAAVAAAVGALGPVARAHGVALILNDLPDLAASLDCDGVHIGQADRPYEEARRAVGADRIVGVTCHGSRHLAMLAAEAGADYVAFGSFFPSETKPTATACDLQILELWQESMLSPCVAIGGIDVANCRSLVAAGADFLAVSAGVWGYPQGPAAAVRAFNTEIFEGLKSARQAPSVVLALPRRLH